MVINNDKETGNRISGIITNVIIIILLLLYGLLSPWVREALSILV